jgi:hypothetical protein
VLKFAAHTLFCSLSLSLCPFLRLHHALSQSQTFHSDATVHDAIINDGNLPEVTTEINQRILKSDCENDPDFLYRDQEGKDCLWASGGKGRNRCQKKQPGTGGKKVFFFCPATCKDRCSPDAPTESPVVARGECENDPTFLYSDQEGKDCSWASTGKGRKRCQKKQPGSGNPGKQVLFFCPATCKDRCSTDAPTESPVVPRGECENDPNFLYRDQEGKDCSWASAGEGRNRCRKKQPGSGNRGKQVLFFCPENCKEKCSTDAPTVMPSGGSPSLLPLSTPSGFPFSVSPSFINSDDPS